MLQTMIVALLVLGSVCYAAWALMPAALRRTLAVSMTAWPLPAPLAARVRQAAQAASSCGCDGCDKSPLKATSAPADTVKPLTFHPRPRR